LKALGSLRSVRRNGAHGGATNSRSPIGSRAARGPSLRRATIGPTTSRVLPKAKPARVSNWGNAWRCFYALPRDRVRNKSPGPLLALLGPPLMSAFTPLSVAERTCPTLGARGLAAACGNCLSGPRLGLPNQGTPVGRSCAAWRISCSRQEP